MAKQTHRNGLYVKPALILHEGRYKGLYPKPWSGLTYIAMHEAVVGKRPLESAFFGDGREAEATRSVWSKELV